MYKLYIALLILGKYVWFTAMATCNPQSEPRNGPTFSPYEKMPWDTNCWPPGQLDAIKKWVALEKVHGANFSFTVHASGPEISSAQAAKRSGFLKTGENFYRLNKHPALLEEEGEKARRLFDIVRATHYNDASSVTVFGELFGGINKFLPCILPSSINSSLLYGLSGSYPHPDVPSVPHAAAIQGGIFYCPNLRFITYDVAVTHGGNRGACVCVCVCVCARARVCVCTCVHVQNVQ